MGWHLSPRYGQVILVSGCPVLTAVKWWQHWCAISFLLCPQTSCKVVWLPNFLGWVDLLTHGAPLACARALIVHNFRKGVGYCLLSQLEMAIDPSVTTPKVHVYRCEFPSPCFAGILSEEFWFHSTETDIHQMRFFKDPDFNLTVFMDAEMNPGPPEIENSRSLLTLHLSPPNSPRCLCLYSRETLLSVLQPVQRFALYTKRSWYSPV